MKKRNLYFLLLSISMPGYLFAMHFFSKNKNTHELKPSWGPEELENKLPRQLPLLKMGKPITDKLLAKLTSEWLALKDSLTLDEKNKILECVCWYPEKDEKKRFMIQRSLIIYLIHSGADCSLKLQNSSRLIYLAAQKDDLHLAQYILSKVNDEAKKQSEKTYHYTKSIKMAKLLVQSNIPMPNNILHSYTENTAINFNLTNYYIKHGALLNTQDAACTTVLHEAVRTKNIKRIVLLLHAGANIELGHNTIFHCLAEHLQNCYPGYSYPNTTAALALWHTIIDHFLEAHHAFLRFLWYLKKKFPGFYQLTDLRKLIFKPISPMLKLQTTIALKNRDPKTAYQLLAINILDPKNYTYDALQKLRKEVTTLSLQCDIDNIFENENNKTIYLHSMFE